MPTQSTQPTEDIGFNKYQLGDGVHIVVTVDMLRLLAHATRCFAGINDIAGKRIEAEELRRFTEMAEETANDPGAPGTVHGFCL